MKRSGVGAQLGIATEGAYGTFVAPTTFLPFTEEDLRLQLTDQKTASIRAGRFVQAENLHKRTDRTVEGGITLDMLDEGMGKLLNQLTGAVVVPTQIGITAAHKAVFPIGVEWPDGKSLSVQVGRPDVGGTVQPFSYVGLKPTQVTFEFEKGGTLVSKWQFDGRDLDTGEALGVATFVEGVPFDFVGGLCEIDGAELVDLVQSGSITIPIPLNTERRGLNRSALKAQPIINSNQAEIAAELNLEFTSLAQQTAFENNDRRKVELLFRGREIEAPEFARCDFIMPVTATVLEGPVVEGPDVLMQTCNFECLDNGTDAPLTIEYVSTDATL